MATKTSSQQGPITDEYHADPEKVCERLNQLRSTELVSYLQYKQHAYMAVSLMGPGVATEFIENPHVTRKGRRRSRLTERLVLESWEFLRRVRWR